MWLHYVPTPRLRSFCQYDANAPHEKLRWHNDHDQVNKWHWLTGWYNWRPKCEFPSRVRGSERRSRHSIPNHHSGMSQELVHHTRYLKTESSGILFYHIALRKWDVFLLWVDTCLVHQDGQVRTHPSYYLTSVAQAIDIIRVSVSDISQMYISINTTTHWHRTDRLPHKLSNGYEKVSNFTHNYKKATWNLIMLPPWDGYHYLHDAWPRTYPISQMYESHIASYDVMLTSMGEMWYESTDCYLMFNDCSIGEILLVTWADARAHMTYRYRKNCSENKKHPLYLTCIF